MRPFSWLLLLASFLAACSGLPGMSAKSPKDIERYIERGLTAETVTARLERDGFACRRHRLEKEADGSIHKYAGGSETTIDRVIGPGDQDYSRASAAVAVVNCIQRPSRGVGPAAFADLYVDDAGKVVDYLIDEL